MDTTTGDLRLWSREMIVELIELYKSYPCLWKVKSDEYKNKLMKAAAYKSLVDFCKEKGFPEATKDFVRRKIQSLRGSFRKELRKTRQFARVGKTHHSNLWYYNNLMFTKGQDNETEDADDERNHSDGDEDTYQSNEDVFEGLEVEDDKYLIQEKSCNVKVSNQDDLQLSPPAKKRKRFTEECIQPEFFDVSQEIPKLKDLSEYELIGMNIAKKLARMDATQAIYAEFIINNVMRKGLLKKLTDETDLCDNMCGKRLLGVLNLSAQL